MGPKTGFFPVLGYFGQFWPFRGGLGPPPRGGVKTGKMYTIGLGDVLCTLCELRLVVHSTRARLGQFSLFRAQAPRTPLGGSWGPPGRGIRCPRRAPARPRAGDPVLGSNSGSESYPQNSMEYGQNGVGPGSQWVEGSKSCPDPKNLGEKMRTRTRARRKRRNREWRKRRVDCI